MGCCVSVPSCATPHAVANPDANAGVIDYGTNGGADAHLRDMERHIEFLRRWAKTRCLGDRPPEFQYRYLPGHSES